MLPRFPSTPSVPQTVSTNLRPRWRRCETEQSIPRWRKSTAPIPNSLNAHQIKQRVLPKILCFHGAGSSGTIFKVQARQLAKCLKDDYELIFVNAPFETTPGPGVLPVFEDSGPFWRWQCDVNAIQKFDITRQQIQEERIQTRQYLANVFRDNGRPDLADLLDGIDSPAQSDTDAGSGVGKVVGLLAFSQGTRVVTGLLAEMDRLLRQRAQLGHHQGSNSLGLKFVVLVCGTYAPLSVARSESRLNFAPSLLSHKYARAQKTLVHPHFDEIISSSSTHTSDDESSMSEDAGSESSSNTETSDDESLPPPNTAADQGNEGEVDHEDGSSFVYRKIRVPSFHFHGLNDPWLPEAQQLSYECYSNGKIFEFDGGHHIPTKLADLEMLKEALATIG